MDELVKMAKYQGEGFFHDIGTGIASGAEQIGGGLAWLAADSAAYLGVDNTYTQALNNTSQKLRQWSAENKSGTLANGIGRATALAVGALTPASAAAEFGGLAGEAMRGQRERGEADTAINAGKAAAGAALEVGANLVPEARLFRPTSFMGKAAANAAEGAAMGGMTQAGQNLQEGRGAGEDVAQAALLGAGGNAGLMSAGRVAGAGARKAAGAVEGLMGKAGGSAGGQVADAVNEITGHNEGFTNSEMGGGNAERLKQGLSEIEQDKANVKQLYGDQAPDVPFNAADVAQAADMPNLASETSARFNKDIASARKYKDAQYQKQSELASLIKSDGESLSQNEASQQVAKQITNEKQKIWQMRGDLQQQTRMNAGDLTLSPAGEQSVSGWMDKLQDLANDYRRSDLLQHKRAADTIDKFRGQASKAKNLWDLHDIETGLLNDSNVYKTLSPQEHAFLRDNLNTIYSGAEGIVNANPQQLQQFNAYRQAIAGLYKNRVEPLNNFSKQMDVGGDKFIQKLHTALTSGANGEGLAGLTYINDDTLKILAGFQLRGSKEFSSSSTQAKNIKTLGSTFESAANAQARELQSTIQKMQSDHVMGGLLQQVGAIDHFQQQANRMLEIAQKGKLYKSAGAEISRGVSAGQGAANSMADAAKNASKVIGAIQHLAHLAHESVEKTGADIAKAESSAIYKQLLNRVDEDVSKAKSTGDYAKYAQAAMKRLQYIAAISSTARDMQSSKEQSVTFGYNEKPAGILPQRTEKPSNDVPAYLQRPEA